MHVQIVKKKLWSRIPPTSKFPFLFYLKQNLLHRIFLIVPVSFSMGNKKIFRKKYGVTNLVFKIDAVDSKKWVKFIAMQQRSATLIYHLNTMKRTLESDFKKKLHSHSKQYSFKPEKLHLVLCLKKTENCYEPP